MGKCTYLQCPLGKHTFFFGMGCLVLPPHGLGRFWIEWHIGSGGQFMAASGASLENPHADPGWLLRRNLGHEVEADWSPLVIHHSSHCPAPELAWARLPRLPSGVNSRRFRVLGPLGEYQ